MPMTQPLTLPAVPSSTPAPDAPAAWTTRTITFPSPPQATAPVPTDRTGDFSYSNLSGRPSGSIVRALGTVVPGVRSIVDDIAPFASWWEQRNREAVGSGRPLWIVLGDSLSQGIGATAPDRGWVGRLADDPPVSLRGLEVVNLSFNGARTVDVLERQLRVCEDLRRHHDVARVTMLIGNNDLMKPSWCRELPGTLQRLLDAVPQGTVVGRQPGMQRTARLFNRLVETAADRRGLHVADFRIPHLRDFAGRLGRDFFHPNDRGYAEMAAAARLTV